jgi:hypothetical protein
MLIMLSVIVLSVVMLNDVMLNFLAQYLKHFTSPKIRLTFLLQPNTVIIVNLENLVFNSLPKVNTHVPSFN